MRFIQQTKLSTTSKKYVRATVERIFFNLVFLHLLNIFLHLLNIRKDYCKPQQFSLKPPTENDAGN